MRPGFPQGGEPNKKREVETAQDLTRAEISICPSSEGVSSLPLIDTDSPEYLTGPLLPPCRHSFKHSSRIAPSRPHRGHCWLAPEARRRQQRPSTAATLSFCRPCSPPLPAASRVLQVRTLPASVPAAFPVGPPGRSPLRPPSTRGHPCFRMIDFKQIHDFTSLTRSL